MASDGPLARALANLPGIVSVLVTGIWLAALFTDQSWWLAFMLVGYIVIVPLTALLFGDAEDVREYWSDDASPETTTIARESATDEDDALATLRERYARGELTDEQFERKVERLLETETLEDVEDSADVSPDTATTRDRDTESELG